MSDDYYKTGETSKVPSLQKLAALRHHEAEAEAEAEADINYLSYLPIKPN